MYTVLQSAGQYGLDLGLQIYICGSPTSVAVWAANAITLVLILNLRPQALDR